MFAIRSCKSKRWVHHINHLVPVSSTKRILLKENMPYLYEHEEIARLEMVENQMSLHTYEIVEVEILVKMTN